jgi:ribA/ribD-fused uncharacterized protein
MRPECTRRVRVNQKESFIAAMAFGKGAQLLASIVNEALLEEDEAKRKAIFDQTVIPAADLAGGAANGTLREFIGDNARKVSRPAEQPLPPKKKQLDSAAQVASGTGEGHERVLKQEPEVGGKRPAKEGKGVDSEDGDNSRSGSGGDSSSEEEAAGSEQDAAEDGHWRRVGGRRQRHKKRRRTSAVSTSSGGGSGSNSWSGRNGSGSGDEDGSSQNGSGHRGTRDDSRSSHRVSTIGFFGVKTGKEKGAPLAEHHALASFCHSKHEDNRVRFVSSHQHFLYLKAKWVGAHNIAKDILKERDPIVMKRMTGKGKLTIDEGEWNKVRLDKMREAITAKFRMPQMREMLLATGDAHLEERNGSEEPEQGNGGFAFWGTGAYGRGGRGSNWNGKILMEERAAIRKGERD